MRFLASELLKRDGRCEDTGILRKRIYESDLRYIFTLPRGNVQKADFGRGEVTPLAVLDLRSSCKFIKRVVHENGGGRILGETRGYQGVAGFFSSGVRNRCAAIRSLRGFGVQTRPGYIVASKRRTGVGEEKRRRG